jgi:cell division protein ZapA
LSAKNSVQVLIGGKVTRLTGYESEEYLEKVAYYLNHKLGELSQLSTWRRMTTDTKGTLLALNVADDCFKARAKAEELEEELQNKDKELYELKQELVELKVELDSLRNHESRNPAPKYDRNGHRIG